MASLSAVVRNTKERASVNFSVRVVSSEVALLSISPVDDIITAVWTTTIESASIWPGVRVECTIITVLQTVKNSVTANRESAVDSASIRGIGIHITIVALFTFLDNSITTFITAHWVTTVSLFTI